MPATTTYQLQSFQTSPDLVKFLNTGSLAVPGGMIAQAKIVTLSFDPGNGRFIVLLAAGY